MSTQPNTIVRLNDYCVAEYSQEQVTMSPSPIFYKLYNNQTGTHHIFNGNGSPTGNAQDFSATYIGPNQYAYIDQDVSLPYWQRFPDKFMYDVPGAYDTFNRVRFHFTSGFDFGAYVGLILSVKNRMNNGSYAFFAQLLVTPDWYVDMVINSPSPIYLADAMFDKYIDVMVPAIQLINQDYYAVPPASRSGEFGALITYNGVSYSGFVTDAPIVISVDECMRIDRQSIGGDVYDIYTTDQHAESVVSIDSLHQRFGAFIGESSVFDAIEFYGTMVDSNGNVAFVEEMINLLSTNAHDDWVIAHQLTVQEWIDGAKTTTGKYIQLQETDFDSPMYYRPILKNSGVALAFEIDYTCRLYNRRNGDQLIRLGSYMSYNAAKYGRSLSVLPLDDMPQSHVVYNKIVKSSLEATELFVEQNYVTTGNNITAGINSGAVPVQVLSFIPMFFNVNAISVSQKDVLPDSDEGASTLVYKQGDLRFILNPFDNMFKFKVHTVNNNGMLVPMDLSGFGSFNLALMNNNKKVKFAYLSESGMSSPRNGELMFKIPQADAETLILSNTREFYITLLASDNTETVLYNGFWNDVTEKDVYDANVARVKAIQDSLVTGTSQLTSSVGTIDISVPNLVATTPVFSSEAINNMQINIPNYVPVSAPSNDVSIVRMIPPAGTPSTASTAQNSAAASLAASLGPQTGVIAAAGVPNSAQSAPTTYNWSTSGNG